MDFGDGKEMRSGLGEIHLIRKDKSPIREGDSCPLEKNGEG